MIISLILNAQPSLNDTMGDLCADTLGGLLIAFIGYFLIKRGILRNFSKGFIIVIKRRRRRWCLIWGRIKKALQPKKTDADVIAPDEIEKLINAHVKRIIHEYFEG